MKLEKLGALIDYYVQNNNMDETFTSLTKWFFS